MSAPDTAILTVEIRYEHDVVLARQRARQIAEALGFERQDQVRLATAVSELARNAFQYGHGGKAEFFLRDGKKQMLMARISDQGAGIRDLNAILDGEYVSETGMGLGIIGARRLMDEFSVESGPAGTRILLGKRLPSVAARVTRQKIGEMAQQLAMKTMQDPFAEIQRQNQELLATMAELEKRGEEMIQLNRELEDTNRGVVALYAELDERADYLRRISESKTRFLSNMTHEFRSPLNSIISLSRMLADRLDGELTPEQERQVGYIRKAAGDLASLVDDLLDLAKVEAGKMTLRVEPFDLKGLFASLRGTLRPLLSQNSVVSLVFVEPDEVPILQSDESKLSQILRNLISNALKYTERGEVRVSAEMDGANQVVISVADTGIGIAPEHQERVFEEFEQVEGAHQLKAKGTGLGLPLARKLTELLAGSITLKSDLGLGSTFFIRLPVAHPSAAEAPENGFLSAFEKKKILLVDDDEAARYVLRGLLAEAGLSAASMIEAASGPEGLRLAEAFRPGLIFLDLRMPGMDGLAVLAALREKAATADVPVIVNTSAQLSDAERATLAARAAGVLSKNETDRLAVLEKLREVLSTAANAAMVRGI